MQQEYVQALVREMRIWRERVSAYDVDTIFIGGGTPSVLSVKVMEGLLAAIHKNFRTDYLEEFTIECNPGTVSEEKFRLYHQFGVNRISFGMQSTIDDELKRLGRIHSYCEFQDSYEMARRQGFENINIDIMSAIPGQTQMSYENTLKRVRALEPEHISSYSLIIEEGTPFYEQYAKNPPVDEDTDRLMYEMTCQVLGEAGYKRYEISNYAREGKECRHNLKYWKRREYLGLGLGAASFLSHTRFSNERDMAGYQNKVGNEEFPVAEWEELGRADEKSEFMYLGLRCMEGISIRQFRECFGEDIDGCFGKAIRQCQEQGLLERKEDRIFLTKRGIDVSNRVFEVFI